MQNSKTTTNPELTHTDRIKGSAKKLKVSPLRSESEMGSVSA